MTWNINIVGHQGTREYGGEEHQAHEQAILERAREFVAGLLGDHDVTTATFSGNTVRDTLLPVVPAAEASPEQGAAADTPQGAEPTT